MKLKRVFRYDPTARLYRLFRATWIRGTVGDGKGYSCKFSAALRLRLFQFHRELDGWLLTLLGVRIHFERSYGGIHA